MYFMLCGFNESYFHQNWANYAGTQVTQEEQFHTSLIILNLIVIICPNVGSYNDSYFDKSFH